MPWKKRMSHNIDRIKDRIRKLLNVARDDAATDGEIANAITAARHMMHAYHLEEADLHSAAAAPKMKSNKVSTYARAISQWEIDLARFIADFIGGIGYYRERNSQFEVIRSGRIVDTSTMVFYGEDEQVALATDLYADLHDTIITMAKLRFRSIPVRGPARSYAEGFVSGIRSKLASADEQAMSAGDTSRALVVRSRELMEHKKSAADRWLAETAKVRLIFTTKRSVRMHIQSAFDKGVRDGERQDIAVDRKRKSALPESNFLPGK
jgi:hypothetical protein